MVSGLTLETRKGAPLIRLMRVYPRRRDPVSRDRYRAIARGAGVRAPVSPRWLHASLALALGIAALVALPLASSAIGAGLGQLVTEVQSAIPLLQGRGSIDLPAGGNTSIGAAPIADSLPAYTRDPQLQLTGKVPSFAVQAGRSVQFVLNGAVVATTLLDPSGAFSATLALKEGANSIGVALIADRDVVAASSYSVVLDRTPPTMTLTQPTAGSTVDSKSIVVAGTTEPGSTITVNGRIVVITPEGAFLDSFSANPGSVPIAVVSRDRAGNETTQKLTVTAQQVTQIVGLTVTVTLDKASAKAGQGVLATVYVVGTTGPRAGVLVTLSVGVASIATAVTDGARVARVPVFAPATEGETSVVVLPPRPSGRASLTTSRYVPYSPARERRQPRRCLRRRAPLRPGPRLGALRRSGDPRVRLSLPRHEAHQRRHRSARDQRDLPRRSRRAHRPAAHPSSHLRGFHRARPLERGGHRSRALPCPRPAPSRPPPGS